MHRLLACSLLAIGFRISACEVGVGVAECAREFQDRTRWSTHLDSSQFDPQTGRPVPGSERRITVRYEFFVNEDVPNYRRTLVIVGPTPKPQSMFEEGEIGDITTDRIKFRPLANSCGEQPDEFTLFYRRRDASLTIDSNPIVTPKIGSLRGLFRSLIADALGDVMRSMLESAFSYGSARAYLVSGHGNFDLEVPPTVDEPSENVCFPASRPGSASAKLASRF